MLLWRLFRRSGRVRDLSALVGSVGLAVSFGLALPLQAATWHVPSECPTIHAALDSAVAGDTVLVAPGVYRVTLDEETHNTIREGITLTSEGGPEVTVIEVCSSWYCVLVEQCEGVIVSGFTMRMDTSCDNMYPVRGLGCWNSTDVIVEDCIFEDLHYGVEASGTSSEWFKPVFRDNVFRGCIYGIACIDMQDPGRPYFLRNIMSECITAGAYVYNSSPMFDSNEIMNCWYGMYYEGDCGGGCRLNKISNNTEDGVVLYPYNQLATPDFNGGLDPNYANDFSGNGGCAIYNGYPGATAGVLAKFNYWGSRCPNFSALFHGPVDYEPWVDSTHTEILHPHDCPDATEPTTWGSIKALFREGAN